MLAMTPNNARITKNHPKRVYNGRIIFLSIFRSCADLKSGMSTFCQSPKIYFESKNLYRIFFSETSSISSFDSAADHQNRFTGSFSAPFRVSRPPPSDPYFNIHVHIKNTLNSRSYLMCSYLTRELQNKESHQQKTPNHLQA